jgi:LysR family transcriptional regulator, hydrogen peroxide-inducible genes activator
MNLRDLAYIVTIAELGNMAKAAEKCHVSQSTLSIQLKKLEAYLGVTIFERNNKRLGATEAGKQIIKVAAGIVHDSRRLRDIATTFHDPMSVTFRLGVFPTLAPYFLPKIMPAVSAAFPRLLPQLVEEKSPVLIDRLLSGDLDAALLSLPIDHNNLATAHIFDDHFFLACHAGHALAKNKKINIADLAGEVLLLLDDGHCLRNQALELCHVAHGKENGEFRATSLETLRYMVASGVGITLIPRIAALPTPHLVYIPFTKKDSPSRKIGLVWRQSSPQKQFIDAFVKLLKKTSSIRHESLTSHGGV